MNLVSLIFGKKPREDRHATALADAIRSDTAEIRRRLSSIEKTMDDLLEASSKTKDKTDDGMGKHH